jgi:glucose-6-phosphate dehydrogenase assembly protein OpcA
MTNSIELAPELGTEVPLSQVEKALSALFASDKAVTRASLMNFAIYSEHPDSLDENTDLIRQVTREHACRAILIALNPRAEALNVRAWVTAHCNVGSGGGKSVCSEQVTFLIEGCNDYLVANTLLARLDSDLPLVFWWQGDFSDNFEPTLYSRIDRLIFDSGGWADPLTQITRLEAAYAERATHFNVMDLAWTRVLQMRLAVASCYDDPHALAELPRVSEVIISHRPSHSLDARMLAAWMAHQAGWEWQFPNAGNRQEYQLLSKEGVRISLMFKPAETEFPVSCIRLSGPNVTCEVQRELTSPFIRSVITSGGQQTQQLQPATINTPAELIVERLRRGCNNRLYFTLLKTVRKLLA